MSAKLHTDERKEQKIALGTGIGTGIIKQTSLCIVTLLVTPLIAFGYTHSVNFAQPGLQQHIPDNKSAIHSPNLSLSTVMTAGVKARRLPNVIPARNRRKSDNTLERPLPAKSFFDKSTTLSSLLEQNPRLRSLDMFQHDRKDTVIDITRNFDQTVPRDSAVVQTNSISSHFPLDNLAPTGYLHTREELQRTYSALLPKITSPKMDNFDELYQLFNSTYFRLARPENATKDPVPYPSYAELNATHIRTKPLLKALPGIEETTKRNGISQNMSMRDYFRALISEKRQRAGLTDDTSKGHVDGFLEVKRSEPAASLSASSEERSNTLRRRINATFPRRFAPRFSQINAKDAANNVALKSTVLMSNSSTTTASSSLPTTSFYIAVDEDAVETSAADLRPWERRRNEESGVDDGISTEIAHVPSATKFVGAESTIAISSTSAPATLADSIDVNQLQERKVLSTAQPPYVINTSKPTSADGTQNLVTLAPFPPIMPGGQFYVDQHVSYGHFGRYADVPNNVVYDPNVLQSRYGFNGILPGSIGADSDRFVDKTHPSTPHSAMTAPPVGPLPSQFSNPSKVSILHKHKPVTFGLQNVPIAIDKLTLLTVDNGTAKKSTPLAGFNTFNQGAALFEIPPPQKLGPARSIPLRVHGQTAVSYGGSLYENKKIAKLLEKSVSKGLLADTNITETRRKTLLSRLNSTPNGASSKLENRGATLFSGGNTADRVLLNVETDETGNSLHWRPIFEPSPNKSPTLSVKKSNPSPPPSLRLVPLPQLIPSIKQAGKSTVIPSIEIENINTFDPAIAPQCYAAEHSSDAVDSKLEHISDHLKPAIQKCFNRAENCVLQNAYPLERRINFSEQQCILFCGSHSYCISIMYSRTNQICDVFNVRNGTGAARLYQHRDFRYYEFSNSSTNVNNNGHSECWKENAPFLTIEDPPGILLDSHDPAVIAPNAPMQGELRNSEARPDNDTALSAVPKDTCAGDRDIIVFKSTGYRLLNPKKDLSSDGQPSRDGEFTEELSTDVSSHVDEPLHQISSETECIFSCLINLARGTTPYECMAATYNTIDSSCLLYSMGDNLNGNIHLIPDIENNHYEKGCITMDLVELCKGYPIIRHAQKTLLGFAMASRFAASFVECIEICFADRQHAHRQNIKTLQNRRYCKSIMYFYEESSNKNCILNSENRESAPAFFVDENEALVDYASFESCYEVHNDVEDLGNGLKTDHTAPHFADFSITTDAPTEPVNFGENTRRAQPTFLYTVDSDSGAQPIRSKQQPSLENPTWQVRNSQYDGGSKMRKTHYADSEETIGENLILPPKAQLPRIVGSLPGLSRITERKRRETERQ